METTQTPLHTSVTMTIHPSLHKNAIGTSRSSLVMSVMGNSHLSSHTNVMMLFAHPYTRVWWWPPILTQDCDGDLSLILPPRPTIYLWRDGDWKRSLNGLTSNYSKWCFHLHFKWCPLQNERWFMWIQSSSFNEWGYTLNIVWEFLF